jgi:hypothetical protein
MQKPSFIAEVSMDARDEVAGLRCDYGRVDLVDWQPVQRFPIFEQITISANELGRSVICLCSR